ncbi:hypothetical protein CEUSTIGMA_g1402.t1 [Chlamydomonas eustigma]|uniref:Methyltransferase small domain-containing protein n=1 Tax=Chlamydomonas eustigma TaxID=1157962 RepID=A0A250WTI5_9CHLO|nr:hypothetical protein CEUSTIGMA_g1402.t1 [Chlamydomonas eustigma]|eukprot:GAX73952.1 hypothetical protein CEUSTIGMA_g1402.t1 [Chlamydomonas eustigma]
MITNMQVSGNADIRVEERLFQVGGITVNIRQVPHASMKRAPLLDPSQSLTWVEDAEVLNQQATGTNERLCLLAASSGSVDQSSQAPDVIDSLMDVGLVTWQAGIILTELLLLTQPCGDWRGSTVIDLGCGTGLLGISLSLAGASVTMTDLPYILQLTSYNVKVNTEFYALSSMPVLVAHSWGDQATAAALCSAPDLIAAADVLYNPECYGALLKTLSMLCAPHTLVYIAWKKRHESEEVFPLLAEDCGFAVDMVPTDDLAAEYKGGVTILKLTFLAKIVAESDVFE